MRLTFAVAVALGLATFASAEPAQAAIRRDTNIPAQKPDLALETFARQRDLQLLYRSDLVADRQTSGAVGQLTNEEALTRLLSGTNLTYRYLDDTSITIVAQTSRDVSSAAEDEGNAMPRDTRLAQATGEETQQDIAGRDRGSNLSLAASDTERLDTSSIDEVVVTGSHIRGSEPVGAKLIVIGREDIEKSGYGRVEDIVATLPQNFGGLNEVNGLNASGSFNDSRGAAIQLRGLGTGTTLTLINGQRQPASGSRGTFVDISSIPTAAIERIEVLPDGASAIYGSDAIGGVVNFILRRDFSGAETSLRFGGTDGGAEETQLSQLFGLAWTSGNALVGYQLY